MRSNSNISVTRDMSLREALSLMDKGASGILLLTAGDGRFERTVTDGDIRRLLLAGATLDDTLDQLPHIDSRVLREGYTRQSALELMAAHGIDHLPVLDARGI